ncbi:aspartate/glutamate racemase family protein [Bacillus subtilis]|uniref:aspartate/glutamate racemase family protein n=1 Tax=Pseudochrobactrum asaccharolyticum TaxID=354351 RepID=UPI001F31206E|nr:aspartate/glutamate racemase family protein [Pseudochrobactrum asaccharolyticum]MCF7644134.1 aspartate/glutamate racemase family protein [Pseudochrobactrum asaccharolyticum]MCF7670627.1 aspartate/glutamate racemase family protein [Bacillus subtilis]
MRILLINPNSTQSMTDQAERSARSAALPTTVIEAINPTDTPRSIEGHADEAMAVPSMLKLIREGETKGFDAYVVACFDDPGLDAAREVAGGPVFGICQAAVQVAMTISKRFSVVTTLPRSVPIIEDLVQEYGATHHCRRVRSIDMPVLALEENACHTEDTLVQEIERAKREDHAEAIVLGCAGMSELCERLEQRCGLPVIDGVTAAVKLAEAYVSAGYRTSKAGAYDYPRVK